jgi:2-amino-4-hydroxy-6-hydroxymethyldihydropteridine diphosphokinase
LGSNLGDREANLREAIARLKRAPGVNFLRQSRVYQTAPIGVTEQPEFLNMVVEVEVAGTPPPDVAGEIDAGRRLREACAGGVHEPRPHATLTAARKNGRMTGPAGE